MDIKKSTLHDLYNENDNKTFNTFFDSVTEKCIIHSRIQNICKKPIDNYVYLLDFPFLFQKLDLSKLLDSYLTFTRKNPTTSYFNRYVAIFILLSGINSGSNYTESKFNSLHNKISGDLHNKNCIHHANAVIELDIYNIFDEALRKLNPYVGELCKCNLEYDSCPSVVWNRFDWAEKIIYETKINDFFYFANCMEKINAVSRGFQIRPITITKISDEQLTIKVLNYFQQTKNTIQAYIYNKQFISDRVITYVVAENITVEHITLPGYCFICEKYDYDVTYDFNPGGYVKKIIDRNVRDFTCIKCKENIIMALNLSENSISVNQLSSPKTTCGSAKKYFQQKRLKPKLLIMANLFDTNSLFTMLPIDVIYHIILSIYWDPINAIPDEYLYIDNPREILYSQFRSVFGITSV